MFKIRVILAVSVIMFLLCSSVNMVPARSFLEEIKRYSKRQGGNWELDFVFCATQKIKCILDPVGNYCLEDPRDPESKCTGKIE